MGLVMDTPIDEKVTQCELSGGEIVINYGSIKTWLGACNLIHKICIELRPGGILKFIQDQA